MVLPSPSDQLFKIDWLQWAAWWGHIYCGFIPLPGNCCFIWEFALKWKEKFQNLLVDQRKTSFFWQLWISGCRQKEEGLLIGGEAKSALWVWVGRSGFIWELWMQKEECLVGQLSFASLRGVGQVSGQRRSMCGCQLLLILIWPITCLSNWMATSAEIKENWC